MRIACLIILFSLFALPVSAATNNVGGSGLPIPRFVALKAQETNIRTGPGTRYPIQWVYHREGLPVEVVEEFEHWRKIRDSEGTAGWVHKTMVFGGRNVLVKAKDARIVRTEPSAKGRPLLKVEPQVIAKVAECEKDWCRIQVNGRKGWIEKKYLFGVYADEVFD